jgi:hypothetical protein
MIEKFAKKQFEAISYNAEHSDEAYILNEQELLAIKKIKRKAIFWAAMLGVLGVVFLVAPQFLFPKWFKESELVLFGTSVSLPLVAWLYAAILVVIEIIALQILNVQAVKQIAKVCNFPNKHSAKYKEHVAALQGAALEKEAKELKQFGINPFFGLPAFSYYAVFIFNKLKATLSNVVAKIIISRFIGRVAMRQLADLVGIPIFAFWNAWATHKVIEEAIIRIMAPELIDKNVALLKSDYGSNESFIALAKDCLQFAAVLKRQYNYAHYYLCKTVFEVFSINDDNFEQDFVQNFAAADKNTQEGLSKLLLLAIVIDGKFSKREKETILKINSAGLLYSEKEIEQKVNIYAQGKGFNF